MNLAVAEQPVVSVPPGIERILFTWPCTNIAKANQLAIFLEGHDMIVRVNRPNKSVELLGFADDEN
jgi:hypothetical protein